jgi:hypothetical protein
MFTGMARLGFFHFQYEVDRYHAQTQYCQNEEDRQEAQDSRVARSFRVAVAAAVAVAAVEFEYTATVYQDQATTKRRCPLSDAGRERLTCARGTSEATDLEVGIGTACWRYLTCVL